MTLVDPIESRIIDHLLTTLRGWSTASGYQFDLKAESVTEELTEILLVPDTELPFVLLQTGGGPRRWVEKPDGIRDDIAVDVVARIEVPEATERRAQGLRFAADLERLLNVDPSRGGLAFDTSLDRPRLMYGIGKDPTVILQHRITMPLYRTYGDP